MSRYENLNELSNDEHTRSYMLQRPHTTTDSLLPFTALYDIVKYYDSLGGRVNYHM